MTRRWSGNLSGSGNLAGERYLGDKKKKEVHDLEHETPECKIEGIVRAENDIAFRTIDDAHDQGYSNCPHCVDEDAGTTCKI
jgi:hypothetical protein